MDRSLDRELIRAIQQKDGAEVLASGVMESYGQPSLYGESGSQIVSLIATAAVIAIEKYDREREA